MRMGPWAPRVRARWCKTQFERTAQQWPVWYAPNITGLYTYFVGPVLVPVAIVGGDFSPGCWRYSQAGHKIRWEGDWSSIAVFGRWAVEVRTNYDLIIEVRMGLQFTDVTGGGGSGMSPWSTDTRSDFIGPTTLSCPFDADFFAIAGTAVMSVHNFSGSGLTYMQIDALGIDKQDTRPVSWAAPDDPW